MYAHRVDILHVADGDHITCAITHNFVFDLFPARNTALYKDLAHTG